MMGWMLFTVALVGGLIMTVMQAFMTASRGRRPVPRQKKGATLRYMETPQ